MAKHELWAVLGKRLNQHQLTQEGRDRVDWLISELLSSKVNSAELCLAFCGGRTQGQAHTEAARLRDYFHQRLAEHGRQWPDSELLLEEHSTNTRENISELSRLLQHQGRLQAGDHLHLRLLSSEHHLQRIYDVQQWLPEQGLLGLIEQDCQAAGIQLHWSARTLGAPYSFSGWRADGYLHLQSLTLYRVYLDAVLANNIKRSLARARATPLAVAQQALAQLQRLAQDPQAPSWFVAILQLLRQLVEHSAPECTQAELSAQHALLEHNFRWLSHWLDPDQ